MWILGTLGILREATSNPGCWKLQILRIFTEQKFQCFKNGVQIGDGPEIIAVNLIPQRARGFSHTTGNDHHSVFLLWSPEIVWMLSPHWGKMISGPPGFFFRTLQAALVGSVGLHCASLLTQNQTLREFLVDFLKLLFGIGRKLILKFRRISAR